MVISDFTTLKARPMYLNLLKFYIEKQVRLYKSLLQGILNTYTEDEILNAIDSIHLVGKYVFMPTSGLNGQILRALEYGTNNTKSYNIITQATKTFEKEVNINGK